MAPFKILELFSGSRSFSKIAEKYGHNTFCVDINNFPNTDYVVDILEIDIDKIPFKPDVIWASPPCTGFSVAAIGHHWTGGKGAYIPKTETAKKGIALLKKTIEIINYFEPEYFYIENPRGLMRKMPELRYIRRNTVTYCQYGDKRMKPTDIWTNDLYWSPKPPCKNGSPCHEAAPRGSRTGTQGLKNNYERSKIPSEFCREIVDSWKLSKNLKRIKSVSKKKGFFN